MRFIPACAGNSLAHVSSKRKPAVHPRLRGELHGSGESECRDHGSSPLARGTRPPAQNLQEPRTVHPRLRGEVIYFVTPKRPVAGSSPLARGTPTYQDMGQTLSRFIPACAGNSYFDTSSKSFCAVHPRLRGELNKSLGICFFCGGSSPLARGTHRRR